MLEVGNGAYFGLRNQAGTEIDDVLPKGCLTLAKFRTLFDLKALYRATVPIFFAMMVIAGCSPTRRLQPDAYLLVRNTVKISDSKIEKDEVARLVRQKPNRKILGFYRFHLQVWSLVNPEKVEARKIELELKADERNKRRLAKGKDPKEPRRSFGQWLMEIGEEPVAFDPSLTRRSAEQMVLYMRSKGYFQATATDTVVFRRRKARVTYNVFAGPRYSIRNFENRVDDARIADLVHLGRLDAQLKAGMPYDADLMQEERTRLTRLMRSSGYFAFTESNIRYQADTSVGGQQVDLRLLIEGVANDSLKPMPSLSLYRLRNVFVHTDFDPKRTQSIRMDTTLLNGVHFIYNRKFRHRPEVLMNKVFFNPGDLYRIRRSEMTYQMLSSLKAFRFINISFNEVKDTLPGELIDAVVQLTPSLKQAFSVEAQGTNTEGNLGISGNFVFQNRNLFRGAEILEFRIKGGMESQVITRGGEDQNLTNYLPFNTLEIGPEVSLSIPKFIVPFGTKFLSRYSNPSTVFRLAYNYQQRPDFTRSIFNTTFGYRWTSGQSHRHQVSLVEVNFVNIYNESQAFKERVAQLQDNLLRNSFRPHLTTLTNYVYTFNNQRINRERNFSFLRLKLESSGNILRGIMAAAQAEKDTTGSFRIFDVPFSQYLKYEFDIRRYWYVGAAGQVVARFYQGLGYPLQNLGSLPFESSFFGGGANGIRAWKPRRLGPGGSSEALNLIDQFGDIKIELNLEYRFNIYRWFKGAVFTDAGNIWLIRADVDRPGGNFEFTRFYKEFAWGGGVGLRLDFKFFVIRLDAAVPFYDPARDEGHRWVNYWPWESTVTVDGVTKKGSWVNLNLGIGYPF